MTDPSWTRPSEPKTPGEILHEARVAAGERRPRPWPPLPWAERDPELKALDEVMAAAVAAADRERLAAILDAMAARAGEAAAGYPPSSPAAKSFLAEAGAYVRAALIVRSGEAPQGEGGEP